MSEQQPGRKVNEVVETWVMGVMPGGGLVMVGPKYRKGDVYVNKVSRLAFRLEGERPDPANGTTFVSLTGELDGQHLSVSHADLEHNWERQESVAEAAARGFRPLMEGDPTFPSKG